MRGFCVRDPSGRAIRIAGSICDIDGYKLPQAALAASEERFALAVAGSNDGIWDWDMINDDMFLSSQGQRLYGLEPGKTNRPRAEWNAMAALLPEDVELQVQQASADLSGKTRMLDTEWQGRHADGSHRWLRIRGVCMFDGDGRRPEWPAP